MTEDTLDFLHNFFGQIGEGSINDQMMEYSYVFPEKGVEEYVDEVCSIPFADFIEHLRQYPFSDEITADDVTQISNLSDCEIGFCNALKNVRRPLTSEDVGVLLQNDGTLRNSGANIKYGENHAKAAVQMGLAQQRYGYWYLSCLGKVYPNLTPDKQKALLSRTILRNRLYAKIFVELTEHDVNMADLWASAQLSESTQLRRRSSVRHFILLVALQASREGYHFSHQLNFTIAGKKEITPLTDSQSSTNSVVKPSILGDDYIPEEPLYYYLNCIKNLHVNRKGDEVAPHKYILMLSLLQLASQGVLSTHHIVIDDLLETTFRKQWERHVRPDSLFKISLNMPYSHMGSEPFWRDGETCATIDLDLLYYLSRKESSQILEFYLEALVEKKSQQDLISELTQGKAKQILSSKKSRSIPYQRDILVALSFLGIKPKECAALTGITIVSVSNTLKELGYAEAKSRTSTKIYNREDLPQAESEPTLSKGEEALVVATTKKLTDLASKNFSTMTPKEKSSWFVVYKRIYKHLAAGLNYPLSEYKRIPMISKLLQLQEKLSKLYRQHEFQTSSHKKLIPNSKVSLESLGASILNLPSTNKETLENLSLVHPLRDETIEEHLRLFVKKLNFLYGNIELQNVDRDGEEEWGVFANQERKLPYYVRLARHTSQDSYLYQIFTFRWVDIDKDIDFDELITERISQLS